MKQYSPYLIQKTELINVMVCYILLLLSHSKSVCSFLTKYFTFQFSVLHSKHPLLTSLCIMHELKLSTFSFLVLSLALAGCIKQNFSMYLEVIPSIFFLWVNTSIFLGIFSVLILSARTLQVVWNCVGLYNGHSSGH